MTSARRTFLAAALVGLLFGVAGCLPAQTSQQPRPKIENWVEPTATPGASESGSGAAGPDTKAPPSARLTAAEYKELTSQVQLLGVGMAGEGGYIIARFKAPAKLATNWQQGRLWVVDEATGVKYDRVPIMPLIGLLLAKPNHPGQAGYVMFENPGRAVHPGTKVTVVLDGFMAQHVIVK